MVEKCYIVEWNTENENLFDDLRSFGFRFSFVFIDKNYFEITIVVREEDLRDLENIMQWYV